MKSASVKSHPRTLSFLRIVASRISSSLLRGSGPIKYGSSLNSFSVHLLISCNGSQGNTSYSFKLVSLKETVGLSWHRDGYLFLKILKSAVDSVLENRIKKRSIIIYYLTVDDIYQRPCDII